MRLAIAGLVKISDDPGQLAKGMEARHYLDLDLIPKTSLPPYCLGEYLIEDTLGDLTLSRIRRLYA